MTEANAKPAAPAQVEAKPAAERAPLAAKPMAKSRVIRGRDIVKDRRIPDYAIQRDAQPSLLSDEDIGWVD